MSLPLTLPSWVTGLVKINVLYFSTRPNQPQGQAQLKPDTGTREGEGVPSGMCLVIVIIFGTRR